MARTRSVATGYSPDERCVPLSAVSWPLDGPPLIDPVWRTVEVLALAGAIRASKRHDLLPVLADALEEAGCDNLYVLEHCRRTTAHIRDCWLISAVLKNPARYPAWGVPESTAPGPWHRPADVSVADAQPIREGTWWWVMAERVFYLCFFGPIVAVFVLIVVGFVAASLRCLLFGCP